MTREEAVAGARERLIRSVELRLRADVPLAFCLSGGVDSVGLAGIATRALGRKVHGFTVVNTDARYEEADMVEAAVSALDVDHHEVPLETDAFLPRLRGLVGGHGMPVATITWYAHWRLMERVAAAGYRVSVSGTAADELFSGYYDHHLMYPARGARRPGACTRRRGRPGRGTSNRSPATRTCATRTSSCATRASAST